MQKLSGNTGDDSNTCVGTQNCVTLYVFVAANIHCINNQGTRSFFSVQDRHSVFANSCCSNTRAQFFLLLYRGIFTHRSCNKLKPFSM